MIFSSKPNKIKLSPIFHWEGFISALFLLIFLGEFLIGEKCNFLFTLSEEDLNSKQTTSVQLNFQNFREKPKRTLPSVLKKIKPNPISEPQTKSLPQSNQTQERSKTGVIEKTTNPSVIQRLAKDLNFAFNRVKYYSQTSQKAGLEGTALLLVKFDEQSKIISIENEYLLPEELSKDLEVSIENLKKTWKGHYKLENPITIRLKVVYQLV